MSEKKKHKPINAKTIGMVIGMAFGAIYSIYFRNSSFTIPIGMGIGLIVGAIFEYFKNRK